MRPRLLVGILLVLTALFCWGLGWIAWGFVRAGGPVGWGLALAVVILLLLSVWVTWREVLFGISAARLGRAYAHSDEETAATSAASPRAEFEAARAHVERRDRDWRAWYRLGLAYDGVRDRRHAREAVRRAIALERDGRAA